MKKFFSVLGGGVWPYIILLLLVVGLIGFGIKFNERGNKIAAHKQEMKDLKSKHEAALDSALADARYWQKELKKSSKIIDGLRLRSASDSLNYIKMIAAVQNTCVSLKTDRDYWKDFAQKLETGDFCVEHYGLFKKKTRLVPRKVDKSEI